MEPVICLGQQPNGFLPKRFFFAKLATARRLQDEIGGRIVLFWHDSDHDYRETQTEIESDRYAEGSVKLNFTFRNKVNRKWSPLALKEATQESVRGILNTLREIVPADVHRMLSSIDTHNVSRFCLQAYRNMGLLDSIEVVSSFSPGFRRKASLGGFGSGEGFFYDTSYMGETVRSEISNGRLRLHHGGPRYSDLGPLPERLDPERISPGRDKRFAWMVPAIGCTHYVMGESEADYLDFSGFRDMEFLQRDEITNPSLAWMPSGSQEG